jgi:hypothetical protein
MGLPFIQIDSGTRILLAGFADIIEMPLPIVKRYENILSSMVIWCGSSDYRDQHTLAHGSPGTINAATHQL